MQICSPFVLLVICGQQMFFEKKKIRIETLNEYLKAIREHLNLSLEEVAEKAGVKNKFLIYLESGQFTMLPADVYVLGFLRKLAQIYGISPEVLIEQYKKEQGIQAQIAKSSKLSKSGLAGLLENLIITPKLVSLAVGVAFVAISVGYIIWQVLSINKTPALEIFEPKDRQMVAGSMVEIKGKTDPGMVVAVNQQNVFVDTNGNFQTQLGISAGPKEFTITAKNKFDKVVTRTISVVGQSQAAAINGKLELKLNFMAEVVLDYSIDDQVPVNRVLKSGDSITLLAKNKVLVSTSNAGATRAVLNNQPLGVLGRAGESLNNISFFAESGNINNSSKQSP